MLWLDRNGNKHNGNSDLSWQTLLLVYLAWMVVIKPELVCLLVLPWHISMYVYVCVPRLWGTIFCIVILPLWQYSGFVFHAHISMNFRIYGCQTNGWRDSEDFPDMARSASWLSPGGSMRSSSYGFHCPWNSVSIGGLGMDPVCILRAHCSSTKQPGSTEEWPLYNNLPWFETVEELEDLHHKMALT